MTSPAYHVGPYKEGGLVAAAWNVAECTCTALLHESAHGVCAWRLSRTSGYIPHARIRRGILSSPSRHALHGHAAEGTCA